VPLAATTRDFITLLPNVQHVTLDGANPTHILHALQKPELFWPELSIITLIPLHAPSASYKKKVWDDLVKVVGNRLELGHPVLRINISSQILQSFTHRQQEGLRANVVLQECSDIDIELPSYN